MDPEFARHYYESAASTDHWWFQGRAEMVERLISLGGPKSGLALDVGAGSTTLIPSRLRTVRLDVVVPEPVGAGPFVKASAISLPFRDSAFDLVGLFDLIEHVSDEAGLLRQVRRVLKPGGQVVATVPAHQWLWSSHDQQAAHVRRYSATELQAVFRMAGFQVSSCRQFYGFLLLPALARKVIGCRSSMTMPPARVNGVLSRIARRSVRRTLSRPGWGLSIAILAFDPG